MIFPSPTQVGVGLKRRVPSVAKVGGDGAYDQIKVYEQLENLHIQPLIPPRVNAVIWIDQAGND